MNKPTNGYYVLIRQHSDNAIVKTLGDYGSIRTAEKAEDGVNINLAGHLFYTESAWYGPDIEPTDNTS